MHREDLKYKVLSSCLFEAKKFYFSVVNYWKKREMIKEYFDDHKTAKVQFGSGTNPISGFLNTDVFGDVPIDIRDELPFDDESVDLIYSNHLVEHINSHDFEKFMKETYRVLKKGGKHIIQTPSLKLIFYILYVDCKGNFEKRKQIMDEHSIITGKCLTKCELMNRIMHINYGHKFLYDDTYIRTVAINCGYIEFTCSRNTSVPPTWYASHLPEFDVWDAETETFVMIK